MSPALSVYDGKMVVKKKSVLIIILIPFILLVYGRLGVKVFNGEDGKRDFRKSAFKPFIKGEIVEDKTTGLLFQKMEKGSFLMGSSPGESGRDSDEGPVAEVCVDSFYISVFETRKSDFLKFTEETGFKTKAEIENYSWIYSELTGNWEKKAGLSWKNPGFHQELDHPVVHVSLADAKAFAHWLSNKSDKYDFRLPTEHEWEYAAKSGGGNEFYKDLCSYANGADLSARKVFKGWKVSGCEDGYVYTSKSGSLEANNAGIFDMLGNVWEWCDSEYKPKISKKNNKIYGKSCKVVIRGGSFYSKPAYLRFSSRDYLSSPEKRGYDIGFRLVMTEK